MNIRNNITVIPIDLTDVRKLIKRRDEKLYIDQFNNLNKIDRRLKGDAAKAH